MSNKSAWITVSKAAELSGYNEEHIRRLLRDRFVTGEKFGIVWKVKRASLIAYLSKAQASEDKRHGPKEKSPDK